MRDIERAGLAHILQTRIGERRNDGGRGNKGGKAAEDLS